MMKSGGLNKPDYRKYLEINIKSLDTLPRLFNFSFFNFLWFFLMCFGISVPFAQKMKNKHLIACLFFCFFVFLFFNTFKLRIMIF